MTYEQALEEIPDIDVFCSLCCNSCNGDWYCPSYCDVLEKARKIDFDRIVKCYAFHNGDLRKVRIYLKSTKLDLRKKFAPSWRNVE